MENVLNFLAEYYLYFMIGAVVLLFALIGFAVDGKKKNKDDGAVMNPNSDSQPQTMQFGQNQQAVNQNNQVENVQNNNQQLEANGMSTGFSEFSTKMPQEQQSVVEPSLDDLNSNTESSNETLTFGPISSDNDSIFTDAPVVDNPNNETLTFEIPSNEPVMESLDLNVPGENIVNSDMTVSMTPEVPVQSEKTEVQTQVQTDVPQMPGLNNTLQ